VDLYKKKYADEPFVWVEEQRLPTLKDVAGSNNCFLGFYYQEEEKRLVIVSVIDNLLKGASGQAVQNMNIVFGFDEAEGLRLVAQNP